MSDTVVIQGEPEAPTDGVAEVAFAAGEATAHVEQLSEDVAEASAVAEGAAAVAEGAAEVATEAVSQAETIIAQNQQIIDQNNAIMAGLQLIAEAIDNQEREPEPEPPKPPKKDTAPRRKSNAHKLLYGEGSK